MTEYQQKQLRKSIYIPKCCRGEVTLCDVLSDTITHTMPEVEKDLISRYLLSDLRGKVV